MTTSPNWQDQGWVPGQPIPRLARSLDWNSWAKQFLFLGNMMRVRVNQPVGRRKGAETLKQPSLACGMSSCWETPSAVLCPDSRGRNLLESWPWVSVRFHFHSGPTASLQLISHHLNSSCLHPRNPNCTFTLYPCPAPKSQTQRKSLKFFLYPRLKPWQYAFLCFLLHVPSHPLLPPKHQTLPIRTHHFL